MVKVACPGCQAPYEIDERRIPPSGLKMRCPKCGTSVPVARPGGEAPAAFAPPPPAPPQAAAPPPAPAAGGFGALDPFGEVDLDGGFELDDGDVEGDSGSIDLPEPVATGGVDLPMTVGQRAAAPAAFAPPAPPPRRAAGGGFGEIDLMGDLGGSPDSSGGEVGLPAVGPAPAPFGAIDLPSTRPLAPGTFGAPPGSGSPAGFQSSGAPQGADDLPMLSATPQGQPGFPARVPPPPPRPTGQAGLPSPSFQQAGLPMAGGNQAGLPSFGGHNAGLPSPGGHAGLPAAGGQASGLPAIGGGLPALGAGGLPALGGHLPTVGGQLPAVGGQMPQLGGSLPQVGGMFPSVGGTFPSVGGQMPMPSAGGMPVHQNAAFPSLGGSLPMGVDSSPMLGGSLPSAAGPGLPSYSPGGLPEVSRSGLPALQAQGDSGDSPGTMIMVGAEGMELPPLPQGSVANVTSTGGRPRPKLADPFEFEAPPKKSKVKYVAGVLTVLALAGALLSFMPRVGPFGAWMISDSLNAKKYDAALATLRKECQAALDGDTYGAATQSVAKADAAHMAAPRHDDTAAYEAFLIYEKSLRFGRDAGAEIKAKSLLDGIDPKKNSDLVAMAKAAAAAIAGQADQAKTQSQAVASKMPNDPDAMVLSGEVLIFAKAADKAIDVFTKAVTAHKSPRTLFGLARAQMTSGKLSEAEATAKSVIEMAPKHVGARIMLASIASDTQTREGEALEFLEKVVNDQSIRSGASDADLVDAYTQLGRLHLAASRLTQAEESFAAALKLNPQAIAGLIGNGELFYRSGRYSEAESRFSAARAADDASIEAKIGVAKTLVALERAKEAKDILKQLLAANPKESRAQYWLGRVDEALGNRKDAQADYEQAITLATKAEVGVPAYVALSHLLASLDKADEASKKLTEAAEKYPNSAELLKARGDIALQTGKFDEAREQYEEALKRSANDLGIKFQLAVTLRKMRAYSEAAAVLDQIAKDDKEYPGLATERGLYFEETGQREQAIAMYAEALKKAPKDIDLKLRIGSTQVVSGHSKDALPILKDVLSERPNSPEANHFYGRAILLNEGNTSDAINYLQKAIDGDPNKAEYHLYVGWAANQSGDQPRASKELTRAIELDGSLADAYWQQGVLLQKQGASREAIKQLLIALDKKPSLSDAYATLGLCFQDESDWGKAEESWKRAIAGNPDVADWHYQLGRIYDRKNAAGDEKAELEAAVKAAAKRDTAPGWLADAHFRLGEAYRGTDKAKAIEHYEEFKKLAPKDSAYLKDADAALAQLKGTR